MSNIHDLISSGKTKEAIEELMGLTKNVGDQDLSNSALLLLTKFNSLKREKLNGTISYENYTLQNNILINNIISLAGEIPNSKPPIQDPIIKEIENLKSEMNEILNLLRKLNEKKNNFEESLIIQHDTGHIFTLKQNIKSISEEIQANKNKYAELKGQLAVLTNESNQ